MTQFVVPIIATWMKFIVTPILGFVSLFLMVGGARSIMRGVQMLRGIRPIPRKATRASTAVAIVVMSVVVVFGAAVAFFLLSLLTTQPYVVTDRGLTIGSRPARYQQRFVPWDQVLRVDCLYTRRGPRRIAYLDIYTDDGRERLPNGATPLEPVNAYLHQRLPAWVATTCR
ncbi:MAG TPA: hypothetical protein VFL34_09385 [Candidatus Sulfotelmatobacter sp.]|nr:hypothetical protein [Candidatus Sulfotelmatobacter sp.]